MNLRKKKELAAKTLNVGKNRVSFNPEGLAEIKEAITKQDIKTLHEEGIISIKPMKGRRKIERRNRKRGSGKIKMKVKNRKQDYVKITRKLRKYLKMLKNENTIDKELYYDLRKKIKMRTFNNLSHLKEYLGSLKIRGIKTSDKKVKRTSNFLLKKESKVSSLSSDNEGQERKIKESKEKTTKNKPSSLSKDNEGHGSKAK